MTKHAKRKQWMSALAALVLAQRNEFAGSVDWNQAGEYFELGYSVELALSKLYSG